MAMAVLLLLHLGQRHPLRTHPPVINVVENHAIIRVNVVQSWDFVARALSFAIAKAHG
jgi:hypothetical protein